MQNSRTPMGLRRQARWLRKRKRELAAIKAIAPCAHGKAWLSAEAERTGNTEAELLRQFDAEFLRTKKRSYMPNTH